MSVITIGKMGEIAKNEEGVRFGCKKIKNDFLSIFLKNRRPGCQVRVGVLKGRQ